jgi:dihydrofolate reductase
MSKTVLYMSMSLDGFAAGPGDDVERLHEWVLGGATSHREPVRTGVNGEVVDEFMATGAVVCGRGTIEPAGHWGGDHHDGAPIFVLSRTKTRSEWPLITYVDDVTRAMAEAKRAAGDKNVLVHGVTVARLAVAAGVLDELQIHLVPVLLGAGRRLFDEIPAELERIRVLEGEGGVTHLRYRVVR